MQNDFLIVAVGLWPALGPLVQQARQTRWPIGISLAQMENESLYVAAIPLVTALVYLAIEILKHLRTHRRK